MITELQVEAVKRIEQEARAVGYQYRRWLPVNDTAALLCCVGAGPWKFARREKIQGKALEFLMQRQWPDLSMIDPDDWHKNSPFPLVWQNSYTMNASSIALYNYPSFSARCADMKKLNFKDAAESLRWLCGTTGQPKVLDLFLRDHLQIPSFPIDRHVRRTLTGLGLPDDPDKMVDICITAGVDTLFVARYLGSKDIDGGNPDWSKVGPGSSPVYSAMATPQMVFGDIVHVKDVARDNLERLLKIARGRNSNEAYRQ